MFNKFVVLLFEEKATFKKSVIFVHTKIELKFIVSCCCELGICICIFISIYNLNLHLYKKN